MFSFRSTRGGGPDQAMVEVAFTDVSLDLQGQRPGFPEALASTVAACGVAFARMNQRHTDDVVVVDAPLAEPHAVPPDADALVTTTPGTGLMVRVADCVPVLLADVDRGVIGAVHSGRRGTELAVVARAVEAMRAQGAQTIGAWIGPHVCGRCYEVPAAMAEEVAALVPETRSRTSWGTPALDLGAGVRAQLAAHDVAAESVGGCTLEDPRYHSYRRDGAAAGRLAGLVWIRG